jgi:hypothetical protein
MLLLHALLLTVVAVMVLLRPKIATDALSNLMASRPSMIAHSNVLLLLTARDVGRTNTLCTRAGS